MRKGSRLSGRLLGHRVHYLCIRLFRGGITCTICRRTSLTLKCRLRYFKAVSLRRLDSRLRLLRLAQRVSGIRRRELVQAILGALSRLRRRGTLILRLAEFPLNSYPTLVGRSCRNWRLRLARSHLRTRTLRLVGRRRLHRR